MTQETTSEIREINLGKLASDLAFNMIDNATHGYDKDEYDHALSLLIENAPVFKNNYPWDKRVRTVLIIGAGASKDACGDIPVADGLVLGLKKIISQSTTLHPEKKEYFRNILNLDGEFASAMQVYVEMIDDLALRDKIKEILNYKYETSLFYEIVAHMFKHKLIDVIINYNFDEILDNVLEDEMGRTQYRKVFFNGDVPSYNSLLFDKRFKEDEIDKLAVPLYIKPHGTVSYPETFQFTNIQYHKNGNNNINKLIKDVLNGEYSTSEGVKSKIPINILSAGYAYNDLDLANMLYDIVNEDNDRPINFFSFDWKTENKFKENSVFFKNEKISAYLNYKKNLCHQYIWVCNAEPDQSTNEKPYSKNLGNAFKALWERTCSIFKLEEKPRDITRHKLLSTLFGGRILKNLEVYFECRIYVELAILIGKADGDILHMNQIEESRVKKYFKLYYDHCDKDDNGKLTSKKSLRHFIEGFVPNILIPYLGFSDTYVLNKPKLGKDREQIINSIFNACFKLVEANFSYKHKGKKGVKEDSRREFKDVCGRKLLYVVNSDISQYYISPFKELGMKNYLYSDMRWSLRSQELLGRDDWNVMLNISEHGALVNEFKKRCLTKKIALYTITADYEQPRGISQMPEISSSENMEHIKLNLPWEIHNKHMSIFLHVNESSNVKFIGGIYYTRRLLTNKVNPIYVGLDRETEPEDIDLSNGKENGNILFDFFCNYWLNARIYSGEKVKKNGDPRSPVVTSLKIEENDYKKNKEDLIKKIRDSLFQRKS